MLEIYILTLFPDMFSGILSESILKRALEEQHVHIEIVNFRNFALDKHKTVDDYPFGGGAGMLLKPQPLIDAVESIRKHSAKSTNHEVVDNELNRLSDNMDYQSVGESNCTKEDGSEFVREISNNVSSVNSSDASGKVPKKFLDEVHMLGPDPFSKERIIMLSPQGKQYKQALAEEFAKMDRLILLCGHYEGFDHRIRQHIVTDEISLGDFVLTGGEIAAMAIVDSVIRLLPGVLGNQESLDNESHSAGLLEYPQYTRPANYRGYTVPETLLSGNHAEIEKWRMRHALYRTWKNRPDLLLNITLTKAQEEIIQRFERGDFTGIDILE